MRNGIAPATCRFETDSGIVHARVSEDVGDPLVRLELGDSGPPRDPVTLVVDGAGYAFASVCVRVPHAVVTVPEADAFADASGFAVFGRVVRHHPHFGPAGTNVNVIHRIDRHTIRMRTYERGVEAETLACGTGAVACAIVSVAEGLVERPVRIRVSGGGELHVDFEPGASGATEIRLSGEARFVATGELHAEGLA